jgi:eukaryotic-like serine/threonine-protein kinase
MFQLITKRPLWVNLIAGLVVMVLLLFLLSTLLGPLTRHGKNKTVPNVTGKSFEEAKRILTSNGFDVEVQDSIYTDTTAKGSVLRQVPEGDAVVKISRTVYLTINRFVPPVIEMPNLVGFSFRNAELQLKNMGLRVGDTSYVPDFARNSIKEQRYNGAPILPGTKIQQGTTIDLVLSNGVGNEEFAVPNLIGMSLQDAMLLLSSNNLSIGTVLPQSFPDSANAYIYDQMPKRFDDDGKKVRIRAGQMMDVWIQAEKPRTDSLTQTPNQ